MKTYEDNVRDDPVAGPLVVNGVDLETAAWASYAVAAVMDKTAELAVAAQSAVELHDFKTLAWCLDAISKVVP